MFFNAVVLVLQEILEAALLISVMLVFTHVLRKEFGNNFKLSLSWVAYALVLGLIGGSIYAVYMAQISEWFDYVGQEVVNASLHVAISCLLILFAVVVPRINKNNSQVISRLTVTCMIGVVALAIVREGSEIIVYLNGAAGQPQTATSVFFGGFIGSGIGISIGVLLFYGLISLRHQWAFRLSLLLLALVAGNMASQAILIFTQADWLPYTPILWDSSSFLPENQMAGQLLYALIGYEATPSLLQVVCYLLGSLAVILSPLFRRAWF